MSLILIIKIRLSPPNFGRFLCVWNWGPYLTQEAIDSIEEWWEKLGISSDEAQYPEWQHYIHHKDVEAIFVKGE
jgi:hypothetical protein